MTFIASHIRLCPFCMARFETVEPVGCPRCKTNSFFTMRVGDIGTAMQLHAACLTVNDFELITSPEFEDEQVQSVNSLDP